MIKILSQLAIVAITILLVILGLASVNALGISYPVQLNVSSRSNELAVVGEGKIEAVPDLAQVSAGVNVVGESSAQSVRNKIDTVNNKLVIMLEKLNIDKKDIRTTNYSVSPNYVYNDEGNKLDGYNGSVSIIIKVREIEKVPQVIQVATEAGANEIYGTDMSVSQPEQYREQARNKAIENAKQQAQKLADQLGIKLGRVTNIVESGEPRFDNVFKTMEMAAPAGMGDGGPIIEPGSQTITSRVTLYFEKY